MSTNPNAFLSAAPGALSWQPSDNGLVAACDPLPTAAGNSNIMTAGTLYLAKIVVRQTVTITNLIYLVQTAGVGASTGSFVGLYNSAGTLLSGSADIGGNLLASVTNVITPLTTPQQIQAGQFVWAAILVNLATTQPTIQRVGSSGSVIFMNLGLTAATFKYAVNGTLLTALPASITPASNTTAGAFTFWAGAS